jgi:hypothetical protein
MWYFFKRGNYSEETAWVSGETLLNFGFNSADAVIDCGWELWSWTERGFALWYATRLHKGEASKHQLSSRGARSWPTEHGTFRNLPKFKLYSPAPPPTSAVLLSVSPVHSGKVIFAPDNPQQTCNFWSFAQECGFWHSLCRRGGYWTHLFSSDST